MYFTEANEDCHRWQRQSNVRFDGVELSKEWWLQSQGPHTFLRPLLLGESVIPPGTFKK